MNRRRDIVAVITGTCFVLSILAGESVVPAVAASSSSTATAPNQLVNQYPLGPQRLCCNQQTGSSGTTGSGATNPSSPPVRVPAAPGRARTPARPSGHGATGGGSAVLLIGLGAVALLVVAGATAGYRKRRRTVRVLGRGFPSPALPLSNGAAPAPILAAGRATSRAEPKWNRSPDPPVAASEAEEREFRRLDANGDAGGAFNLGVVLHQRADVDGARAAYERAEERGDPDATFNLGVLLYEAGDLDGAEAAWRRSAGRGHVRAAANLLFLSRRRRQLEDGVATRSEAPGLAEFEELSYRRADDSGAATGAFNLGTMLHQQGDPAGALAAYERAERRGDRDAAFNLGVLLYEIGDFDGAEDAWRRSAERGHARAAENLGFLIRHRHELDAAEVGGRVGDDR